MAKGVSVGKAAKVMFRFTGRANQQGASGFAMELYSGKKDRPPLGKTPQAKREEKKKVRKRENKTERESIRQTEGKRL